MAYSKRTHRDLFETGVQCCPVENSRNMFIKTGFLELQMMYQILRFADFHDILHLYLQKMSYIPEICKIRKFDVYIFYPIFTNN